MNSVFRDSYDFSSDEVAARRYAESRNQDALKFSKSLVWKNDEDCTFAFAVYADVYGSRIVHDMPGDVLGAGGCWGELFTGDDSVRFATFYCFVAYMLAKYW